jgi:hypothetical protein
MSNTLTQLRAAKGGEIGANGEFYEGGKFIARSDRSKKLGSKKPTGRREIEFGVWVDGVEGKLTLWSVLAGIEIWNRDQNTFSFNANLRGHFADDDCVSQRNAWIQSWNKGERWREIL